MNCFYHPEKEAVAQCTECNKGLCNECATRFNKPICDVISGDGFAMLAFFFLKIIAVLFIGAFVTPFYLLYCIYKIVKISILLKKI